MPMQPNSVYITLLIEAQSVVHYPGFFVDSKNYLFGAYRTE